MKGRTNTSPGERGMEGCRIQVSTQGRASLVESTKTYKGKTTVAVALGSYTWGARM